MTWVKFVLFSILFTREIIAFLHQEYRDGYTNCSTNDSEPIVFKGIDLKQFRESQKRFYDITDDQYICDLGDDRNCDSWWTLDDWKRVSSIRNGMTEVLMDERWQELKVQQLEDKFQNGTEKYTKLFSADDKTIVVPISWSISKDAEFLFCSEEIIQVSHCAKISFLRGIQLQMTGFVNGKIETLANETNWVDGKWRSFLWSIEKGRFKFKQYVNNATKFEINYPVPYDVTLKHLFGHSTGPKDFVKIHNYNFLRTQKAGFHQIGRPFHMKRGSVCITMYVTMCKTCKMIFMMSEKEVANVQMAEEGTWKNIRINVTGSKNRYEQLYVLNIGNNYANREKNYWALDFVKLCSAVRFIALPGFYACEHPEPFTQKKCCDSFESGFSKLCSGSSPHCVFIDRSVDFFRIISFNNDTISFIYKNNNDSKEVRKDNPSISFACSKNYVFGTGKAFIGKARSLQKCTLWPDYFCGSINLSMNEMDEPHQPFLIDCKCTFFNVDEKKNSHLQLYLRDSFAEYEVVDPPRNLAVKCIVGKNDISIKWSHPFVGETYVKGFKINMILSDHTQTKLKQYSSYYYIKKPKKEYWFSIDKYTYESCSNYFIQVRTVRNTGLGFASTQTITTGPFLPSVEIEKLERSENVTFSIRSLHSTKKCHKSHVDFAKFIIILESIGGNQSASKEMRGLEEILNKKFNGTYRILKKYKMENSTAKSKFEIFLGDLEVLEITDSGSKYELLNYTANFEEENHLIILEVVTYRRNVKHYEHIFYFGGSNGSSDYSIMIWIIAIPPILIGLLAVFFTYCWCYICRKRKRKVIESTRRPRTIENIYFLGDRVQLLDKKLSITKQDGGLDTGCETLVHHPHFTHFQKELEGKKSANSDSKPVRIADFEKYLKMAISNKELTTQFESLPKNLTKPCEIGQLECNRPKNRFKDIIPYDHTRVKLQMTKNREGSDYINASFIMGHKNKKSYIAAQGPKSLTINDFWRMIWQENVRNIIMLVNLTEEGVKKVEKYWPNPNEDFQFGEVHIFHDYSEILADYEIRGFRLVCGGSERKVYQYHFKNWPDDGVPIPFQSLVTFIRKTLEIHTKSPTLVHCCSGISATGVFILCHICLGMAHEDGIIDVFKVAKQLREQRVNMIHNLTQYKLAHLLILEGLAGLQAVISCNDDIDKLVAKLTGPEELKLQMVYLEDLSWQYRSLFEDSHYAGSYKVYMEKNKVADIFPDAIGAVELDKYPEKDESSGYINAVKVDGYQFSQRYIVTQQPMPNTLNDFWRMVVQHEVNVIISLNDINLKDKKSCTIWPCEDNPVISPVDFIILKHHSTVKNENYEVIEMLVMVQGKKKKSMKVTIASLKGWKSKALLPESPQHFLKFCGFVDSITRQLKNTVVTCYDGCLASGVYVATSYLIDMIKVQKSFDICNIIRSIRRDRKQFITGEKQLAFLYEIAATYIKGYQDYANFGACSQVCYNIYDYIVWNDSDDIVENS
ncbi:uncharacterized protein LOC123309916 isoform X2 [Coccinella septempunctata]|uniref:uncharacterized protein LOC123309916 isoform X2 n=1 Tax=Coccinella septempunctata TaxID=41139 RepID=UPI001D067586|nr:uncharacterized protein LOC123309916 isoform X2 [Coccinella septempunctata]